MSPQDIEKMNQERKHYAKKGFGRWSWYAMVDKLADGDITKHEAIYNLNFISCLNHLSYLKEKAAEDKRIQEQSKNK